MAKEWIGIAFGSSVLGAFLGAVLDDPILNRIFPPNVAPVASISPQIGKANLGFSHVLDGSASLDPDGDTLTFSWSLDGETVGNGNSECSCSGASCDESPALQCTFVRPGARSISLKVTDRDQSHASSSAIVEINPPLVFLYIVPDTGKDNSLIARAIYHAIDWSALPDAFENLSVAPMVFDPETLAQRPAVSYEFDPQLSLELIAEAGAAAEDPVEILLTSPGSPVPAILQPYLEDVGLEVRWASMPGGGGGSPLLSGSGDVLATFVTQDRLPRFLDDVEMIRNAARQGDQ